MSGEKGRPVVKVVDKPRLADGSRYTGEVFAPEAGSGFAGKPDGQGCRTFRDGRRYEGEWRQGREHGRGVLTMPDGTRYEGGWSYGNPVGEHVRTAPDGSIGRCVWRDGGWQDVAAAPADHKALCEAYKAA